MDYQFEKRICQSAKNILVAGGFSAAQVFGQAITNPETGTLDTMTPRVELKFSYGGVHEFDRKPIAGAGEDNRTYFHRHQGVLQISVVTDRDWNLSSQSAWLNLIRKAMIFSTDAQWLNADGNGNWQGYDLEHFRPIASSYEMNTEKKQDITREQYEVIFNAPAADFTEA